MSHWIFVTRYPAEEGKATGHERVHYYYLLIVHDVQSKQFESLYE